MREMPIKPAFDSLTPVVTEKPANTGEDAGKRNPYSLLIGMQTCAAPIELRVEGPQKKLKTTISSLSYTTVGCYPKGTDNGIPQRYQNVRT